MTLAVNYLGPFLLTSLLHPLLRKSTGSRIVTVASSAHEDVNTIHWENLPQERRYDPWAAYSLSKFADVAFTYTLARNLAGSGVTANCLHPGVVDTKNSPVRVSRYVCNHTGRGGSDIVACTIPGGGWSIGPVFRQPAASPVFFIVI
jgi:NAD(P)-dependent dehydrogenase (short-subunit alcohol dehydrogenase family)